MPTYALLKAPATNQQKGRKAFSQETEEEEVPTASVAPTKALVTGIIAQKRDYQEGDHPEKKTKLTEKKPKKAGGSINMKDVYLPIRHLAIMLRGNLITRDQAIPDYVYRAMGKLIVNTRKFKCLKASFKAMSDDVFSEFIDQGVR